MTKPPKRAVLARRAVWVLIAVAAVFNGAAFLLGPLNVLSVAVFAVAVLGAMLTEWSYAKTWPRKDRQ